MMSNGRMVKSLKLKLRIFGALAGMTSLLITLLPTYVQAETDPVQWVEDADTSHYDMEDLPGGTDTLVKEYKGTETNLRIPAQMNGKRVVLQRGFKLSDAVKNLNISRVKLQEATTNNSKLFAGYPKVTKIIFQEKDGSNTNTFDTSAVTDMSGLFEGCENLSELDLSSLDTRAVTDMSGMFKGCKSLQTLTFGDTFNTTQVADIHEMFQGCESLKSLDLSAFDLGRFDPSTLDQSKVADFLNGVTASTILSPKKNLLEDKIALPVSGNEYYNEENTNNNFRFLPKTDSGSRTLKKKTGIKTVTPVTDRPAYEMYLGDTLSLEVNKVPQSETDNLTWEVFDSNNTPLSTPNDYMEITTTTDTNCKLTAKKAGTYYVQVKPSIDYSWLTSDNKENLKKTWKVTVEQGYRAEVEDNRSDLLPEAKNTAKGFSEEGKYRIQISDNAANLEQAVKSGQSYKNAYMAKYFTLKLEKTTAPAFNSSSYKPIKVTLPIPQSVKSLIAKGHDPGLLSIQGSTIYPVKYQFDQDKSSVTFEVSGGDLQNLEAQYALIYKTNPDGSANGSSGSSNSANGTSGAIIVNVSPTPITVNVQAGSSSSANSSNSSSNGSSNGSVIIYQNPNGINGGNVIRTLGGGGINGMDMPKTADSMSIRYRTLGAMIMALLGALLFLSSFLVGGRVGNQPALAVSAESRKKRRFEADEDSRWLE